MWLLKLFFVALFLIAANARNEFAQFVVFLLAGFLFWRDQTAREDQAARLRELRASLRQYQEALDAMNLERAQWLAMSLLAEEIAQTSLAADKKNLAYQELDKLRAELHNDAPPDSEERRDLLNALWQRLNERLDGELGRSPWLPALPPARAPEPPRPQPVAEKRPPSVAVESRQPARAEPIRHTPPPVPTVVETPPVAPPLPARQASSAGTVFWQRLAGWLPSRDFFREILMPFIWQNIGWFIGGFCFISGSILLVMYSQGFGRALAVYGSLSAYTLLLAWGGYQLRKRRPDLRNAANVLLILAMLLIPLDFAGAARLLGNGESLASFQTLLGIIAILAGLVVFSLVARLASGAIARNLQGEHAALFTILAALPLAAPWLQPVQETLAPLLHLLILGLLAWALRRFAQDWLKQWFLDRDALAGYAAGTLVYAAIVSFFGLGWRMSASYTGAYLMALNGLLLYADLHLKYWAKQHAWLNYFSFVVYALLAPALVLAYGDMPMLAIVLGLGTLIYGLMLWHHLSLPPLYLSIGCAAGLYGLLVLRQFPDAWYFLAGLPGLSGLLALQRFALRRRSEALALLAYRLIMVILSGLLGWSLFHAEPGWLGFLNALAASALVWWTLAGWAEEPPTTAPPGLRGYLFIAMVVLSLAYAPVFLNTWAMQFSLSLAVLAAIGAWAGTRPHTILPPPVLLNTALIGIAASLALLPYPTLLEMLAGGQVGLSPIWLVIPALDAAILLMLGLALRAEALFSLGLALIAGLAVLIKRLYFPSVSSGMGVMLAGLGVCGVLWWLKGINSKYDSGLAQSTLLGLPFTPAPSRAATAYNPLRYALWLLWAVGLWRLAVVWLDTPFHASLVLPTLTGALLSVLLAGQERRAWLVSVALLLTILALLPITPVPETWLPGLVAGYALALWLIVLPLLPSPRAWQGLRWQGGWGASGGQAAVETALHWTVAALQTVVLTVALMALLHPFTGLLPPALSLSNGLAALAINLAFFAIAGWRYRQTSHSYLALLCLGVAGLILWKAQVGFGQPADLVIVLAAVSAALAWLAAWLEPPPEQADSVFAQLYRLPLYHAGLSLFLYGLLMGISGLFWPMPPAWPGVVFSLLALALLPLARLHPDPPALRSLALPLLLGAAWLNTWLVIGGALWAGLMAWSFILLGVAMYGLPRLNARWPRIAVDIAPWHPLGLVALAGGFVAGILAVDQGPFHYPVMLGLSSLYLMLAQHATGWRWPVWLAAPALLLAGVLGLAEIFGAESPVFVISAVLWLNLLWWTSPRASALAVPLRAWVEGVSALLLAGLLWQAGMSAFMSALQVTEPVEVTQIWLSSLLLLSFGLVSLIRQQNSATHATLIALLPLLSQFATFYPGYSLPLLCLVWGLLLALARCAPPFVRAAEFWQPYAMLGALLALAGLPTLFDWQAVGVLAVLGGQRSIACWASQKDAQPNLHCWSGFLLLWAALHLAWFTLLPGIALTAPLSWLALQNLLLAWLLHRVFDLREESALLALAGMLMWLAHGVIALLGLATLPGGHLAAIAGGLLLALLWWQKQDDEDTKIYGAAFFLGLSGLYLRLFWLGPVPPMLWDTVAVLSISYGLLMAYYTTRSRALYRLTLLLPLLALFTVPWQLGSVPATLALLAAGSLYLLLPRERAGLPVYLGLLALNAGLYLWIPGIAENYKLLQLYTVPAALTALLMLELHWLELRQNIRNGVRLAALSTLYASATWDVFASASPAVFLLVLGLSLLGILLGIALRVRVFLYTGTVFLIFNVASQMLHFTPQGHLAIPMVLMAVGGVITAGMILFSLQREAILKRIRIIRADLAEWE